MIILHRQNNITNIEEDGIEIDIRSSIYGLVLNHNRLNHYKKYPLLKTEIKKLNKDKIIIANIKESGIEEEIIDIFESLGYKNYYFLDSQIPDIIRISREKPNLSHKFIIRVSEYESLNENLLKLNPKYIWVDYNFSKFDIVEYRKFINRIKCKAELIYVSPELYGNEHLEKTKLISSHINIYNICTKRPDIWRNKCLI